MPLPSTVLEPSTARAMTPQQRPALWLTRPPRRIEAAERWTALAYRGEPWVVRFTLNRSNSRTVHEVRWADGWLDPLPSNLPSVVAARLHRQMRRHREEATPQQKLSAYRRRQLVAAAGDLSHRTMKP